MVSMQAEAKPAKEEKKSQASKVSKERKSKASKPSALSHPPYYFQMIKEALLVLNERTGSSRYAIAKHMEEKHKGVLPVNYKKVLANRLKNFTAKGKLVKVKASFKLSKAGKEEAKLTRKERKPAKVEKPKEASSGATKRKAPSIVDATKKQPAASSKAARAKPKQPKSIKSPTTRKAKKVAS